MALAAYRHLLRATRIAFTGDGVMLHAARSQARAGFDKQKNLTAESKEATDEIVRAEGVAAFLKHNLVQGAFNESEQTLKLRIHEHTERGDNDTIKNPRAPSGKVKIGGA